MQSADIAIVGGGLVGMALALALRQQGIAAEIFEARQRSSALADQRILALSHGSRQILESLGVWSAISSTPIKTIHVSQQGGLGRACMTAVEQGVPALGHVAAASSIAAALDAAVATAKIVYREGRRVEQTHGTASGINLECAGDVIPTRLVVYAEGAIAADTAAVVRDYGQDAVICTARAELLSPNVAYERFTPQGPLALLPYAGQLAVVYTCPADQAVVLANLPDADFLARLQTHFGSRLTFLSVSPRQVFPLVLRYRKSPVATRCVWLGNAAQTLHPVAGQGFNLALRDVWELSRILAGAADPGAASVLSRYAAARRCDRRGVIGFTDGLIRVFGNPNPLLRHARGLGLMAMDLLPPLRGFIARRMMYGARAWP
ncbi:MAG: FAD-dependent monooxygenase [Betaproteobacteria bacterium]|nr:FAD-dependent monooxygenase [Betaproteobacteria bacterium]